MLLRNFFLIEEIKCLQEISNSVWSWATSGFGSAADEAINLRVVQIEEDRTLVIQALEAVAKSSLKRLPKFRPQVSSLES